MTWLNWQLIGLYHFYQQMPKELCQILATESIRDLKSSGNPKSTVPWSKQIGLTCFEGWMLRPWRDVWTPHLRPKLRWFAFPSWLAKILATKGAFNSPTATANLNHKSSTMFNSGTVNPWLLDSWLDIYYLFGGSPSGLISPGLTFHCWKKTDDDCLCFYVYLSCHL